MAHNSTFLIKVAALFSYFLSLTAVSGAPGRDTSLVECVAPLPNLLSHQPVTTQDVPHDLRRALSSLNEHLKQLSSSTSTLDSLSIGVVTPGGLIWSKGYGKLKANDSSSNQTPDQNSIYKIGSVTKMFTVLETLLLKEKGLLNLDDPIEKYVPPLKSLESSYGWAQHLQGRAQNSTVPSAGRKTESITFRQLASHMSGFGREYPLIEVGHWPLSRNATGTPAPITLEGVLKDVLGSPLVAVPNTYPIYSNVGFGLLGMSNVEANRRGQATEPKTHKELLQRDIFDPLGMTSSFYVPPNVPEIKARMAVASKNPFVVDVPLGDVADGAGGQYSSLTDLAKAMQIFLSPTAPSPELKFFPGLMREWLRPVHLWADGTQAVGAPWEINYMPLENKASKRVAIYNKAGDLPGFHSMFTLNPEYGYGIVLMITGDYADTLSVVSKALQILQPAFDTTLKERVKSTYVGKYVLEGGHGQNHAEVTLHGGQLRLARLMVSGVNVLEMLQQGLPGEHQAAKLWSTGRPHEFRMTFGREGMGGCLPRWTSIDPAFVNHGAATDLVYWEDGHLVYPSAGVRFDKRR